MRTLLVYPYFRPHRDRSSFRFPPLGLGYLAARLQQGGHEVSILDCTFLQRPAALERALAWAGDVVGIYSMYPFHQDSIDFARQLRGKCRLLVTGGPMPSCDPFLFARDFDVVVRGEGENALAEIIAAYEGKTPFDAIQGLTYHIGSNGQFMTTPPRQLETNLDSLPLPARDLLPNSDYIAYWRRKADNATTTIITSRGCPFDCEFCSNAVFGNTYRERSADNVLDEVENALRLGYDRIHFADDVFTLRKARVLAVCDGIRARKLRFAWECLCRVDLLDLEMAKAMKEAGCDRVFFGIESANETTLKTMRKRLTPAVARRAVSTAGQAGLRTGAFFILCYPGDTDESVLETIRFANSLPLDYVSFTLPYPIPGTGLHQRMKGRLRQSYKTSGSVITEHFLTYDADFSDAKMKFAILKGKSQFKLRKILGTRGQFATRCLEKASDAIFRLMK